MQHIKMAGKRLWEDIYSLRFAILGIAVYYLAVHVLFGQFCPMMILLHFPCPGCGMTRALIFVLTGRWAAAWELQPFIFGWILLGLWFATDRYLRNCRSVWLKRFLAVLILGTFGLYVWRLLHGFPTELFNP